jgi:hypothetical protein
MTMNYYAQPRLTRDIDIVVELTPADADRVHQLFAADFYCDPAAVREAIVAGVRVWLVSPEDLLLSKLFWAKDSHSELQLNDARNLIASVLAIDWPYTERWASELSVATLLDEVRR